MQETTMAGKRAWRHFELGFLLLLAPGCATLQDPMRANLSAADAAVAECAAWFRVLDQRIDRVGARDGGEYRVPGFPYLRVDRFSASFRTEALAGGTSFQAWTQRLLRLEEHARAAELQNLPAGSLEDLAADHAIAAQRTQACAATLAEHDFAIPELRDLLVKRARVPDDYVTWQRAVGLYAVTRIPFWYGVDGWQRETAAAMRRARDGLHDGATLLRYLPTGEPGTGMARTILAGAPRDVLGIPQLSDEQRAALFNAFAPVIEVETSGEYDRIGSLAWGRDQRLIVDASQPLVYRKLAYTRSGGETLVQLVYLAWFSERPRANSLDLLAGRLDGIFWRVTLSAQGDPLVYDTIHPCGCFHMFFPVPGVEPLPSPASGIEWAFVPVPAPALADGSRVALRLASRTHYVVKVEADGGGKGQAYDFADYDELRSVPAGAGEYRSVFRPDALVPGTERGERLFFWPMGVPSAGAMRQWGHHATAFVGRRHFDDVDLIERRFRLPPP